MEIWILLWKALFVVSLSAFSVMAIVVTIGGYKDLRRLIVKLKENS